MNAPVGPAIGDGTRILVATSWYPSYDLPARASFVADQVGALVRSGLRVEVVSPEEAYWFGTYGSGGGARHRAAGSAWCDAIRSGGVRASPTSWAVPGVPTSRLPVSAEPMVRTGFDARAIAAASAEALLAWADLPGTETPALVHAHIGFPDGVAAIALAERLGVPLITTEHDSTAETRLALPDVRNAYLGLLDEGRMLLAVSDSLRRRLADVLRVDAGRIGVVPNVVDVDAFPGVPGSAGREERELLWVGGHKTSKGMETLLVAFARLRGSRPGLRLRLIGRARTAAEDERFATLARDLGVLDAVAFEGQLPREAVAAAMARATVFVHPSPSETFGVVAAEALAAGLPVAATPSGGVEEIVGLDGRFGEIADGPGADALAAAIVRVLDDPGRFDADAMRASVVERFGPDTVAAQLRDRYAELLARRAARATPATGHAVPVGRDRDERVATGADGHVAADRAEPLAVAVGLQRKLAARRLAAMPVAIAQSLLVVTSGKRKDDDPDLPDGPRWIELEPDRDYDAARAALIGGRRPAGLPGRIARFLRSPLRSMRLRRLAAERPVLRAGRLRADLAAILTSLGPAAGIEIIALAADDVDLVLPLLDERVRLSPSTLRGHVDQWDAAGRPARPAAPGSAAPAG